MLNGVRYSDLLLVDLFFTQRGGSSPPPNEIYTLAERGPKGERREEVIPPAPVKKKLYLLPFSFKKKKNKEIEGSCLSSNSHLD